MRRDTPNGRDCQREKINGMCYTAYTIMSSNTTSKYLLQKKFIGTCNKTHLYTNKKHLTKGQWLNPLIGMFNIQQQILTFKFRIFMHLKI